MEWKSRKNEFNENPATGGYGNLRRQGSGRKKLIAALRKGEKK